MDDPETNEEEGTSGPAGDGGQAPDDSAPEVRDPLEAAKAEASKLKDQLLRTAADLDNFRKRARREQAEAERKSREDFLRDLLPVFDNLERAVSHAEKAADVASVVEGIQMVMRQFTDTLNKLKVERIPSVGQPFDPAVHEAIQQLETVEHPPGVVAAEIQAGYRTPDRVIRPSLVVVAKAPA